MPGGRVACIHNSWLDPKKVREMTIIGTKGMILYDDVEPMQKVKIYDIRVDKNKLPYTDTLADFQYAYHYGGMQAAIH